MRSVTRNLQKVKTIPASVTWQATRDRITAAARAICLRIIAYDDPKINQWENAFRIQREKEALEWNLANALHEYLTVTSGLCEETVLLQGIVLYGLWGFEESNGHVVFDVTFDFPL